MAQVKKLDEKRRAVFPEGFLAGDALVEEVDGDQVTYRLIRRDEVPLAKIVAKEGHSLIKAPLERAVIADSVRRDRDER